MKAYGARGRGGRARKRALGLAAALCAACGGATAPDDGLEGGVLATFEVSGERFHAWVTSPTAIDAIFQVRDGVSPANIPNGAIRAGSGAEGHNEPWGWHFDPSDFEMAELAVEVCDGRPSLVDQLLDDYLRVGRFCPWGATLVSVEDRR